MIKSKQRAVYEAQLATASRALWRASDAAESAGDPGAMEDCLALRTEVSRLMGDSINGKRRKPRQLSLIDTPCT